MMTIRREYSENNLQFRKSFLKAVFTGSLLLLQTQSKVKSLQSVLSEVFGLARPAGIGSQRNLWLSIQANVDA
jgi:hypothetical protein